MAITTFNQCFVEERNKVLTLSCEGIIDVEAQRIELVFTNKTYSISDFMFFGEVCP